MEKGYETGLHAPGLKLPGTGLYKAAHNIIKVRWILLEGWPPVPAQLPRGSEHVLDPLWSHLWVRLLCARGCISSTCVFLDTETCHWSLRVMSEPRGGACGCEEW